jgi:hypothetical protein
MIETLNSKFYSKSCLMCRKEFNNKQNPRTMKLRLLITDRTWKYLCEGCSQSTIYFWDSFKC